MPAKTFLVPRDLRSGIPDVFLEARFAPDNGRILVGIRIVEVGARMAADEAVEFRADLVLRILANGVAQPALFE